MTDPAPSTPAAADSRRARVRFPNRPLLLLALAVAAGVTLLVVDVPDIAKFRQWADETGPWFAAVFFAAYVGFTQLPIPRTVFTLSSGMFFGVGPGIALALVATSVSALISLTVVRFAARDWARQFLVRYPRLLRLDERLGRRGWLTVGSMRMIAAIPFAPLNYACALTSLRVRHFFFATLVGSAPGTIATVIMGDAIVGGADWRFLLVTAALLTLGLFGLVLDSRLPIRDEVKGAR